jgi:hypothetical protein
MGFVTQTDVQRLDGKAQYTFRPRSSVLRSIAVHAGGKHQTHVDGAPRDANAFVGASFDLHSGDGLSVTHVRGYIDLADTEVTLYSSGNRPLSASCNASLQRLWDGDLTALAGSLTLKAGSHLALSGTYTRSEAALPGGSLVAHVAGLRAGWSFSTRLSADVHTQYNSLERKLVGNFRLHFIHRPGGDLYLVFNEERGEPGDPAPLLARGAAVKLSYLVRF